MLRYILLFFGFFFVPFGTEAKDKVYEYAGRAEVKFEKSRIKIGSKTIHVEVAKTNEQRMHGLMFRESMPENNGMVFIFEDEQPLAFWMKNTLIPLQIGYFDENKTLVDLVEMVPAPLGEMYPRSYPSKHSAKFALEMNKGWFTKNKIAIGTKFTFLDAALEKATRPSSKSN